MSCRGCNLIQMSAMNFNGRIDTGGEALSLCCENIPCIPKVAFAETPEETLRRFMGECALVSAESRFLPAQARRVFTAGCAQCANYQEGEFVGNGQIHYVNLSMYPAPCQSRCIYCDVYKEADAMKSEAAKNAYEHLFAVLDLAKASGIIHPDAVWQVSSGEIAIHPYHDRIMNLVQGRRAVFYTNCMKYDEEIARNLHDNPGSAINLSIDAGIPETWRKVKGIDNFGEVTSNLAKYYAKGGRPGQIQLKYIVLPDINDTFEDYCALMEIMKVLEVTHLTLSRDTWKKYAMTEEENVKLLGGAAYLLAICHKNGISNDAFTFTPEERTQVLALAQEILRTGQI